MAQKFNELETAHSPLDAFAIAEQQICTLFETVVQAATKRRDQLLQQLHNLKLEYLDNEEMRKKQVQDLEKLVEQMEEIQIQQNTIMKLQEEHTNKIKDELKTYQIPTTLPVCDIGTENLQQILQQLESIGTIRESNVPTMNPDPTRSIGKGGGINRELKDPLGICLDKEENIYVCDSGNSRIQVFLKDGEFYAEFGSNHLNKPYGIAIYDRWILISDWKLDAVFKFLMSDYELAIRSAKTGILGPKGLTVDENENEVLVADSNNHRIVVLNSELHFVRSFGKGKLDYPCDVRINISNRIFVADKSKSFNVHVFSKSGDLLYNMIGLKDDTAFLSKMFRTYHMFICFNRSNIMISDCGIKSIQVYTIDGQFQHSVKCEGNPRGLAVTDGSTVLCATDNPDTVVFM